MQGKKHWAPNNYSAYGILFRPCILNSKGSLYTHTRTAHICIHVMYYYIQAGLAKRTYAPANRIRRFSSVRVLLGYGAKDPSWNIPFKI